MKNRVHQSHPIVKLFLSVLLTPALLLFSFSQAVAKEPDGSHNKVYFSIQSSEKVENDMASITFNHVAEGLSAQDVTEQINQQMKKAFKAIERESYIVKKTSQYNIHPVYKKSVISHWRGQQSLTITLSNGPQLASILKKIQPHLSYQSMHFSVSEKIKQQTGKKLLALALRKFQAQAKTIANGLGSSKYQIIETRINTPSYSNPRPYARAELASVGAKMAPSVAGGESQLSVNISGTMLLPN